MSNETFFLFNFARLGRRSAIQASGPTCEWCKKEAAQFVLNKGKTADEAQNNQNRQFYVCSNTCADRAKECLLVSLMWGS